MIKNSQITVIVVILATLTALAVVMTPGTQSAFAANTKGVKGGTPCAHSSVSNEQNPVTMPTITIFVCEAYH
jgi:hypothetical protein